MRFKFFRGRNPVPSTLVRSLATIIALVAAVPSSLGMTACSSIRRAEECNRVVDLINAEAATLTQSAQMDPASAPEDAKKIEAFEKKLAEISTTDSGLKKIVEEYRSMLRDFATLTRDAGKPDLRAPELAKRSDALQRREDELVEKLHGYCNK